MSETRREFLDTLLYTSLAATAVALAVPVPFYLAAPADAMRRRPVSAGPAASLAEGQRINIVFGGRPAVVVRVGGELRAFSRVCTHRNCPVNWKDGRFHCPCHGAYFDAAGKPVKGPAKKALESLPCTVDAKGEIIVGG